MKPELRNFLKNYGCSETLAKDVVVRQGSSFYYVSLYGNISPDTELGKAKIATGEPLRYLIDNIPPNALRAVADFAEALWHFNHQIMDA